MKIPDSYDTIFSLTFDDPELAGAQVRLRRSYGLLDSAGSLVDVDLAAFAAGRARPEDLAKLRQLVDDFAGALVSWNLDDEQGEPLGTDLRTVRGQSDLFVVALVSAFLTALTDQATAARTELEERAAAAEVDETVLPMSVAG